MRFVDLGKMSYRQAWQRQIEAHQHVAAGEEEVVFFVEHDPVITIGRRPGVIRNLIASEEELNRLGVEIVESDRGGDITFHGPGQLVVYPIIRLADHRLSVGGHVHHLEDIVIDTLKCLDILMAVKDPAAPGVWIHDEGHLAKICAIGVRIRKGISMHGIALNVTTDLSYFDLIVPCGLAGRPATSLQKLRPDKDWNISEVRSLLQAQFQKKM